jgi:hypothetical protein
MQAGRPAPRDLAPPHTPPHPTIPFARHRTPLRFSTRWGDKGYMYLRADCPENRGALSIYRDKYITLPIGE